MYQREWRAPRNGDRDTASVRVPVAVVTLVLALSACGGSEVAKPPDRSDRGTPRRARRRIDRPRRHRRERHGRGLGLSPGRERLGLLRRPRQSTGTPAANGRGHGDGARRVRRSRDRRQTRAGGPGRRDRLGGFTRGRGDARARGHLVRGRRHRRATASTPPSDSGTTARPPSRRPHSPEAGSAQMWARHYREPLQVVIERPGRSRCATDERSPRERAVLRELALLVQPLGRPRRVCTARARTRGVTTRPTTSRSSGTVWTEASTSASAAPGSSSPTRRACAST